MGVHPACFTAIHPALESCESVLPGHEAKPLLSFRGVLDVRPQGRLYGSTIKTPSTPASIGIRCGNGSGSLGRAQHAGDEGRQLRRGRDSLSAKQPATRAHCSSCGLFGNDADRVNGGWKWGFLHDLSHRRANRETENRINTLRSGSRKPLQARSGGRGDATPLVPAWPRSWLIDRARAKTCRLTTMKMCIRLS